MATKLKRIDALNDYVAIMMIPLAPKGVIVDAAIEAKYTNEGVVVGLGPDAGNQVKLGDRVIVRQSNYQVVKPEAGDYKGKNIILAHKLDLVLRKPLKEGDEEFVVED